MTTTRAENVRFYQRLLAVAGLAVITFLVYRIVEPFLGPIAWALFIGFLLQPAQARMVKWFRGRASVSAFALTMLVLILFLGPMTALALAFARQAADLAGRLQTWIGQQQRHSFEELTQLPVVGGVMDWLEQNLAISTSHVAASPA